MKKGADVTVVESHTLPWEKMFGKRVGAGFARFLHKKGVTFLGNTSVKLFRGDEVVTGVELEVSIRCSSLPAVRG